MELKVKKIVVLLTDGTDIITIFYEGKPTFPNMNNEPILKTETQKNYGIEYCKKNFNINPVVVDVRINNVNKC